MKQKFRWIFLLCFSFVIPSSTKPTIARRAVVEIAEIVIATENPEDVLREAMEVYAYFELYPLSLLDKIRVDGYARIEDPALDTVRELKAYCQMYFSEEICARLLGNGKYREIEGYLYAKRNGREKRRDIVSTSILVYEQSDKRMAYEVKVKYGNEKGKTRMESFFFIREQLHESWVFTVFPFYW